MAAIDSCFALVGAHQHGIASTVSLADHVFYCRGGCKSTPLSQLHTTHVVAFGWELKNSSPTACVWRWDLQKTCVLNKGEIAVHGCHCPGDMVVRIGKVQGRIQDFF